MVTLKSKVVKSVNLARIYYHIPVEAYTIFIRIEYVLSISMNCHMHRQLKINSV